MFRTAPSIPWVFPGCCTRPLTNPFPGPSGVSCLPINPFPRFPQARLLPFMVTSFAPNVHAPKSGFYSQCTKLSLCHLGFCCACAPLRNSPLTLLSLPLQSWLAGSGSPGGLEAHFTCCLGIKSLGWEGVAVHWGVCEAAPS